MPQSPPAHGPNGRNRHAAPSAQDSRPSRPDAHPRQQAPGFADGPLQQRRPVTPPTPAPVPHLNPRDRQPAPARHTPQQPPPDRSPTMHVPSPGGNQGDHRPLAYSHIPDQPGVPDPRDGHGARPGVIPAQPHRMPPQQHPQHLAPPVGAPAHADPRHAADRRRFPANPFRRSPGRKLRLGRIALVVVIALVVGTIGGVFYFDNKLHRVDALASYAGRPGPTPGTTWLIVGTDSRADLSQADKDRLATGDGDGSRTDTIMLVHKPPSGSPMIISIPRDLYVEIPGNGQHKINAAFNFGGPKLLARTVEQLTGLRLDHYGEVGFGGFADLVDAVGDVNICIDQSLNDPKAGLRLKKGCHDLNGTQALGLVRTRAFPNADLERVVNQRKFLSALMSKATSPGVVLNPFRLVPFVNGAVDSLTVDKNDHIWNLVGLAVALRGDPTTTTTPNAGSQYTGDGDSLMVGSNTEEFFGYLRAGKPIPDSLIENNGGAIE
ncbi:MULTISPECIES: LCP family protein [Gordonia]|nr:MULTISPECIES: LCP family protein [Gordonia]